MSLLENTKELYGKYGQAVSCLPPRFREKAHTLSDSVKESAEEFRLRIGRKPAVRVGIYETELDVCDCVSREDLNTVLEIATGSSVHTAQSSIKEGFVTVSGGHRIGLCGTVITAHDGVSGFRDLSSVSIRIAKQIKTAAEGMCEAIKKNGSPGNTLIVSPPGCGKTTVLRDLVRRLSDKGYRIAVADERGEIAAKQNGFPQFDVGRCTDVIDGTGKSHAAMMMLRSMTPDIIALDEITHERDVDAIYQICNCGTKIIATAHGEGLSSLSERPLYRALSDMQIFDFAITLYREKGIFRHKVCKL